MNPTRALPLLMLFSSLAFPQTFDEQFSSQLFRANCPVELRANLTLTPKILPVQKERSGDTGNEHLITISLRNPKMEMTGARMTIHGFPIGIRIDPGVVYFPNHPAEIRRTARFDRKVAAGQDASFDFSVSDFGTVTSIDLDSVTYADGSTWRPENTNLCRAVRLSSIDAAAETIPR